MCCSWNALDLAPPPNRYFLTRDLDLLQLKKVCASLLKILLHQNALHSEAALLSRFIYRMKMKFRSDKGFKAMEKVNRCLRQYLRLNLASMYNNFASNIRITADSEGEKSVSAPTKQMLEYLLMRTQGFTKLMCRTVHLCGGAANALKARLDIGHSWNLALLAISMIARIWSLSKYLTLSTCDHFEKIRPFLEKLQYVGPVWSCSDAVFPKDLRIWLNADWLTGNECSKQEGHLAEKENKALDRMFCDSNGTSVQELKDSLLLDSVAMDLGEPISRLYMKKECSASGHLPPQDNSAWIKGPFHNVKSAQDLMKFLRKEEKIRLMQREAAITRNMDNLQFNFLTKKIHKTVKKLNEMAKEIENVKYEKALNKYKKLLGLYIIH